MLHRRLVYIYLLNVPSFSSRYFNKIKRTSSLGRLLALSLDILSDRLADGVPPSYENFEHINPVNVTVSQHVQFQFLVLVYDPDTTKSGSPSLFKWRFVAGVPMMAQY